MRDTAAAYGSEAVTYEARLHWILFVPPLLMVGAGLTAIVFNVLAAIALLMAAALAILGAYVKLVTTRIVVTDRRVIYRAGLIARRVHEMNKDKVESIDVSQSMIGRLLGFGNVTVKGTGGGMEAIGSVAAPFALRDQVASRMAGANFAGSSLEPVNARI